MIYRRLGELKFNKGWLVVDKYNYDLIADKVNNYLLKNKCFIDFEFIKPYLKYNFSISRSNIIFNEIIISVDVLNIELTIKLKNESNNIEPLIKVYENLINFLDEV